VKVCAVDETWSGLKLVIRKELREAVVALTCEWFALSGGRHEGRPKVIELLNEALKNELTATNQYWLHYRLLDNWGVHKLAEFERSESIDEMKHADRLAERILFLDGLPNFQALGRLRIGENVEEILAATWSSSWRRSSS
jgi:hypothetical protein